MMVSSMTMCPGRVWAKGLAFRLGCRGWFCASGLPLGPPAVWRCDGSPCWRCLIRLLCGRAQRSRAWPCSRRGLFWLLSCSCLVLPLHIGETLCLIRQAWRVQPQLLHGVGLACWRPVSLLSACRLLRTRFSDSKARLCCLIKLRSCQGLGAIAWYGRLFCPWLLIGWLGVIKHESASPRGPCHMQGVILLQIRLYTSQQPT